MYEHPAPGVLRIGQHVVASGELVGEVVEELVAEGADFLHVRRFGPGLDDLFIPTMAIDHLEGDRIYLNIRWPALAAQAWHVRPAGAVVRSTVGPSGTAAPTA